MRAIILLVSMSLTQQAFGKGFTVFGLGNSSCGTWVEERSHQSALSRELEGWVHGYLSAAGNYGRSDFTKRLDQPAIRTWMDNRCRNNPLDFVIQAADALARELMPKNSN